MDNFVDIFAVAAKRASAVRIVRYIFNMHMPKSQKILVGAYAFSPTLGSEFAQGWNYVQNMKADYRLTVLVGSSDGRMGDFSQLDHPAVTALAGEVEIVAIRPDWFCNLIKWLDVTMGMHWLFVLGLRRWHWLAYRTASRLHRQQPFAAAHQLGPVGFRNPGYLHRLDIPSYWGPIGGFQYIDLHMAVRSSPKYGAISVIRNISTYIAARSGYVRSAVRGFSRLSFATETNRRNFAALYRVAGPVLSDQATAGAAATVDAASKRPSPPLRVIWCGSVDARKNIRLLIDIAERLHQMDSPVDITVIGSGAMLSGAIRRVENLQLARLRFTGQIPRTEVQGLFRNAHILCFTSLSEANTSTFFEALEAGCVPFALDLDGFSSNITDDIGYKIDIGPGWWAVVEDYAGKLDALSNDPVRLLQFSQAVQAALPAHSWQALAGRHREILNSLLVTQRMEIDGGNA